MKLCEFSLALKIRKKRSSDPCYSHLWFVTLHPFEDGNGRIARAIGDLLLARADGSPLRFYSLSAQIQRERKAYYDILERTQKRSMDVTEWLGWYLDTLLRAVDQAQHTLDTVLGKVRFWQRWASTPFNEQQLGSDESLCALPSAQKSGEKKRSSDPTTLTPLFLAPLTRPQFDECQYRVDDGCVDLNQSPEFCDCCHQGIGLQHTTTFEILQHGSFMCADGCRAGDALIDAERKFHAQAFSNRLCFQHHGAGHGAGSGIGADRLQGGAGQCTDGIKTQVAP